VMLPKTQALTPTHYWLLKSEPSTYSWDDLISQGKTMWEGVRNHQAKNNLKAMAVGDLGLFYHSMKGKCVVGVCQIVSTTYPDPTEETGRWLVVDVVPVCPMQQFVTLEDIKANPALADLALLKQSRLSVMPIPKEAFHLILAMGKTTLMDGVTP
jgi:predicted RNA-binding protein with PUA-like domain